MNTARLGGITIFCEVDAVLFDLDDTLLDRKATFANYCCNLIDRRFPTNACSEQRAAAKVFLTELDDRGYRNRMEVFARFIERWGLSCTVDDLVREWTDGFGASAVPQAGMRELLDHLKGHCKLGIVTNGLTAMQHRKLDSLGISDLFGTVLISEQAGVHKPDPAIYHMACAALDVEPGRTLFVGDNLRLDVQGPRDAGLQAVWFQRGSTEDGVIGRLIDLRGLFQ